MQTNRKWFLVKDKCCFFVSGRTMFLRSTVDTARVGDQLWRHFAPSGDESGWSHSSQQSCLCLWSLFFWFTLTLTSENQKPRQCWGRQTPSSQTRWRQLGTFWWWQRSGATWCFQQMEMDIGAVGMSAWETSLQIIQERHPEFWRSAPPGSPFFEPNHTKNQFHHWLFVFYINRSGTDGFFVVWEGWSGRNNFFPSFFVFFGSQILPKHHGLMLLYHIINPGSFSSLETWWEWGRRSDLWNGLFFKQHRGQRSGLKTERIK